MQYRRMGQSGLQLSVLSFGSWVTFGKQIDDFRCDMLMSVAYEHGINFFDNAEVYAHGESELMMGRVLKLKQWDRSSYVLSSKAYFGRNGSKYNKPNQWGLSRKHLTEACHEALNRLQTDYLDLFFCHRPDPNVPMEEIVRTMNTLITQGKVLYWGTSEWSAAGIAEAWEVAARLGLEGPVVEQPEYNLFARRNVEVALQPVFEKYQIGATIWSPLASGLLTGKYNDGIPEDSRLGLAGFDWLKDKTLSAERIEKVRRLQRIADELGCSLAALSIAWTISNPRVTTAILGATKEQQLLENLKALEVLPLLTESLLLDIRNLLDAA